MKIPMFTSYRSVQDDAAYRERRVVSKHEFYSARKNQDFYRSREAFLRMKDQYPKKVALGKYLVDYLKTISTKSVLGLGSGDSLQEYTIKLTAPDIRITTTDFDSFIVEKVAEYLPEIDSVEVLDIKKDDFNRFRGKYDTILMIGVIYALSNDEIIDFFKRIINSDMKHILITTSLLSIHHTLGYYFIRFIGHNPISQLIRNHFLRIGRPGRFHGWARSKGEFTRLTEKAGTVKLLEVITLPSPNEDEALLHIIPIK